MPTYKVTVIYSEPQAKTVTIEADSIEDAEEEAINLFDWGQDVVVDEIEEI